jgi:hypothetical protein
MKGCENVNCRVRHWSKAVLYLASAPNTACTGQVRAVAHTFGIQPQTADSASGGFVRQFPHLPVTPAVETVEKGANLP